MKKSILILADTNLLIDGRIRRHIFALEKDYDLIVTGTENPNIGNDIEFINCSKEPISEDELIEKRKTLRKRMFNKEYEKAYWSESYIERLYENLKLKHFDIILANDISMIPLGVRISEERNIRVIADMHEYAPKEFEDIEEWRMTFQEYKYYLCRKYLKKCDVVLTVSSGLASEFHKEFDIKPYVLTNAPKYEGFKVKNTTDEIKLVYHGAVSNSRNLDELIELINYLDNRYSLDFYLMINNNDKYCNELIQKIRDTERCFIKDPVPPEKIVEMLHKYDIGVYLLKPTNFNNKYALPNKFFEFIQARLAIAIGPVEEMKFYVDKYHCGIVAEDFTAKELANKLNALTNKEIDELKKNSNQVANIENSEKNKELLLKLIKEII
ncbi:MAG: glycosyltransferase [Clostridium beijerinckii]|jgi:glycosyltransferase involved in cell wall biosynthesis|uniref:glycosyltransferase n=1 Tax=Clostridium beijerinckii TaxID=1520 RepID=UPI001494046D|nr:glycosyltransferase [Clostridium beijerinckii]MCI1477719.1 glycosyltransferase [Clostridium beijerinckii]MCI1577965.1 glycosyltransferase [Clostridium beijerinckii]MCI1583687.1 glycosyltransferase [Clostridium beijerinckii]MCI1620624.1 glycosyltransferase [Clostridium beijerinckii]NOW87861.1 glycosyltransferase involved in cell wall biosynthesis [Clostridium beijerinckii]